MNTPKSQTQPARVSNLGHHFFEKSQDKHKIFDFINEVHIFLADYWLIA